MQSADEEKQYVAAFHCLQPRHQHTFTVRPGRRSVGTLPDSDVRILQSSGLATVAEIGKTNDGDCSVCWNYFQNLMVHSCGFAISLIESRYEFKHRHPDLFHPSQTTTDFISYYLKTFLALEVCDFRFNNQGDLFFNQVANFALTFNRSDFK